MSCLFNPRGLRKAFRLPSLMSILQLRDVTLERGGKRILDGLCLDFREAYVHAVIGPNGAGKSTLASLIMGLSGYTDHRGDVLFEGESIKRLSVDERARCGITLAWQEPARFEGLSVRSFILAGVKEKSVDTVCRSLGQVDLDPRKYIDRAVDKTLSGGERKRIELAGILAMEPKLVLMDEPDSGIDIEALDCIFQVLRTLKQNNVTVVLITHSLPVLRHADHGFLLCGGRLVREGPAEEIASYFRRKCAACGDSPTSPAKATSS